MKSIETVLKNKNNDECRDKYVELTKVFLENYKNFKKTSLYGPCENAVDFQGINKILNIQAILNNSKSSKIAYNQIRRAINSVRAILIRKNEICKLRAVELKYFNKDTYKEVARKLNSDGKSVARWINEVEEELSILMFGIDALNLEIDEPDELFFENDEDYENE